MVQYCRKCGKELADDAEFCDGCGFNLNENPNTEQVEKHSNDNKNEFTTKLPLILAVVGIVVSIAEGLGTPMLMGWDNILTAMAIGIVGGLIGIVLMEKLDEPLIAAVEFIATGALIYMFIARFGEISAVLFIIAAILTLYFKGYYAHNKKLWLIPILTVVLIFVMLIAGGALYHANAENSIEVDLEVSVNYYDNQDKIIHSGIAWNDLNPESGKTYHFDGMYFDNKAPAKAEVKVVDSAKSTTPLYTENITISTKGGV